MEREERGEERREGIYSLAPASQDLKPGLLADYVSLEKLPNISGLQFPHL